MTANKSSSLNLCIGLHNSTHTNVPAISDYLKTVIVETEDEDDIGSEDDDSDYDVFQVSTS